VQQQRQQASRQVKQVSEQARQALPDHLRTLAQILSEQARRQSAASQQQGSERGQDRER
jgi:ribosome recycling factor